MSRVDSVKVGAMKAVLPLAGTVLAFRCILSVRGRRGGSREIWNHGVDSARGSVRDDEVIAAADRLGLAMVFTGIRHFRH